MKNAKKVSAGVVLSRIIFIILLSLSVFSIYSCTKPPRPQLKIGTNLWAGYTPLYLARNMGALEDSKYKLIQYTSATEVIRSFRNKSIDLAAITIDEAVKLYNDGRDFKIVLVLDESSGADAIIAQPQIKKVNQLKNKKIGVEHTALGGYILSLFLNQQKWTNNDIRVIYMEPSQHVKAFKNKTIDAVMTYEPVLSEIKDLKGNILFDSSMIPGKILDVLVADSSVLQSHPEDIKQLIQTWQKSLNHINQNPDISFELITRTKSSNKQNVQTLFKGIRLLGLEENISLLTGDIPLKQTVNELNAFNVSASGTDKKFNLDNMFSVPDEWYHTKNILTND